MGIDIDKWQGLVTVGGISAEAPAVGRLVIGDVIEGVGGKDCHNDLTEVPGCMHWRRPGYLRFDTARVPTVRYSLGIMCV